MPRGFALFLLAALAGAHAQPVPVTVPGAQFVVPPPVIDGPRPPPVAPPPPPLDIPKPAAITTCDPGGCWDSQGRRLDRSGPLLMGPHGACVVQAGVVRCP